MVHSDIETSGENPIPRERLSICIEVLEALARDKRAIYALAEEDRIALLKAAGLVAEPDRLLDRTMSRLQRRERKKELRARDRERRERTGIREARRPAVFEAPSPALPHFAGEGERRRPELERPLNCYVCKKEYRRVHHFYDSMCPECAELNYTKRFQTAPLPGRAAVVTGARVKIGYHIALKLLRAGARVIATTRFPHDAAQRYAREEDFADWRDRLSVWGLDLRHAPSVERFAERLVATEPRLDFVISNACQTVRRPPAFYEHLIEHELRPIDSLPGPEQKVLRGWEEAVRDLRAHDASPLIATEGAESAALALVRSSRGVPVGLVASAQLSQLRAAFDDDGFRAFPKDARDADLQQVDLREVNSWRLRLAEVPTWELLEVHLVNAVAPFILAARLKPLLLRDRTGDKHVVNVSAMEGSFSRGTKTDRHPHTNMAKAALNMLTLTSAPDYVKDGIHMNAVDTGWVTDEDPAAHATRKRDSLGFQPPLDIVDGAARVVDPIFSGLLTGVHPWGKFFKDYKPTSW